MTYYPYESFTDDNNDVYFLINGNNISATACTFINQIPTNFIDLFKNIGNYLNASVTNDLSTITDKGNQIFEFNLRKIILNDSSETNKNDFTNNTGIFSNEKRNEAYKKWNKLNTEQKVNLFNNTIRQIYLLYGCASGNVTQLNSDSESTSTLDMNKHYEPIIPQTDMSNGLPRGDAVLDNLNLVRERLSSMSSNIKKMSVRKINENIEGIYNNMSYMRELVNKIDYNTNTIRNHPEEFKRVMNDIKKFLLVISIVISKTASNNDVKNIKTEIDTVNKKINYIIDKKKNEPNLMKIVVYIGAIMIFLNVLILILLSYKGQTNV